MSKRIMIYKKIIGYTLIFATFCSITSLGLGYVSQNLVKMIEICGVSLMMAFCLWVGVRMTGDED